MIVISTVQVTHIKRWGGEGRGKGEEIFSYISGINTPSPCTVVKSTEWIEREKTTQVQTCVCVCVCSWDCHRACTSLERKRGLQGWQEENKQLYCLWMRTVWASGPSGRQVARKLWCDHKVYCLAWWTATSQLQECCCFNQSPTASSLCLVSWLSPRPSIFGTKNVER